MKKGEFKKTDYNEIRECVKCHERKLITEFVKGKGELYRYRCKSCCNEALRTGRPKKGGFKKTDYNEIRECVDCHERKLITEFVKGKGELYRYQCKDCKNNARRTGRPNEGKFKPGHLFGKRYEKGHIPWHKGTIGIKPGKRTSESRHSAKTLEWKRQVLERDGHKCTRCGGDFMIAAHHIMPWKTHPDLRFDLQNGVSLCSFCHGKEEGFQKGHITVMSAEARKRVAEANRGRVFSKETRRKMSLAKKGKPGPRTGGFVSDESRQKMRLAKLGKTLSDETKEKMRAAQLVRHAKDNKKHDINNK